MPAEVWGPAPMLHQAVAANQKEAALDIQSKELSQGSTCRSSHTSTHAVSDAGEVRASGTQEDPIQHHQLCPTEPCLEVGAGVSGSQHRHIHGLGLTLPWGIQAAALSPQAELLLPEDSTAPRGGFKGSCLGQGLGAFPASISSLSSSLCSCLCSVIASPASLTRSFSFSFL